MKTIELTEMLRSRLIGALRSDDTLPDHTWVRVVNALERLPNGTDLPFELPNGSDGETDEERVSIALDYYGLA